MDAEERKAAVRKELDDAWLELDRVLSSASEGPDDPALEAVTPFLSSDELVVVDEPPAAEPPAVSGRLVHQRHDSSMLFSTTTFREVAMTAMRGFAAAQANALVTVPVRARASQAIATVVPIALPATAASSRDKWLWRSLTIATAALLFFFVAALDLLIVGGGGALGGR